MLEINMGIKLISHAVMVLVVFGASIPVLARQDVTLPLGPRDIQWQSISENQKALLLERYVSEIKYCQNRINKDFESLDSSKLGYDESYTGIVNKVTEGLIGFKYVRYGDIYKGVVHFYKEWVDYKKCLSLKKQHCSADGPGDYNPLAQLIGELEREDAYYEAIKYYPEYLEYLANNFTGKTKQDKMRALILHAENGAKEDVYTIAVTGFKKAQELSKTAIPKLLDPAVQHHEWFYGDKQDEVLKALGYYYQNKVRFMLEKALAHKDPVAAAKAREYLEKLGKGEKNETETKKP